ncbi:MAG: KOW domain-containing RNA-binding protein [Bacillota bacterium]
MPERDLRLGQVVCSLAGRDRGQYYVVVGVIDDRFVQVADGYRRKVAAPKKKNVRHLRPQGPVMEELAHRLAAGGSVNDSEIRGVLRKVQLEAQEPGEKGG